MLIKKKKGLIVLLVSSIIIAISTPKSLIEVYAKENSPVPEYKYLLDVDAVEFNVSNDKLKIKGNSKIISKGYGKNKKTIGGIDYLKQSDQLNDVLLSDQGLEENLKKLVQSSNPNNKIIAISVTDVYYKLNEQTNKIEKVTKEEYEQKNDKVIKNLDSSLLSQRVYASTTSTIGSSTSPQSLYGKLTLTTSVSCDLSSGSSRVFWAQSNAGWSGIYNFKSSRDFISIGCDASSWKPTINKISTCSWYGSNNPSWSNQTLSQANGSALMWSFNFHEAGYQAYDYLTGIYAGAKYAYGSDGYATFYSNYTHTYSVLTATGTVSSKGAITISGTSSCDNLANYATCYLTTYYSE